MSRFGRSRSRGAEAPRPVFVMSPGRTGTTLLMKLLDTSRDIWVPGDYPKETRLLALLTGGIRAVAGPNGGIAVEAALAADAAASDTAKRLAQSTRRLSLAEVARGDRGGAFGPVLRGAWGGLCESAGIDARYYAEKSIGLSIPDGIDALDPLVIHLVRDPRDIAVSVREFDKARGFSGFGRAMDESDESYTSRLMGLYRTMFRMATEGPAQRPEREIRVRYEDIVTDRGGPARTIGEWLGVEIPGRRVSEAGEHATSDSPESSIGRWRTELEAAAARVFADEIGDLLEACGYEV